jgi:ATP-dependent Clp protease ATP-binding subunit ClpA
VFLLDEADKAHPDVMQPFLNLFDEGWLYDQRGIKAYGDRAIFILTTNVGQRQVADMFRSGKTIDEITYAMKETLARTKHTKSNRPVFTPEFLARLKRIIIFKPLDQGGMLGITRKLVDDMARDWLHKRQKTLLVPEPMIQAIAKRAHAVNERSQGKEGGRIVRKLLAEFVEAPAQRAISDAPDQYRRCDRIELIVSSADLAALESRQVRVSFLVAD